MKTQQIGLKELKRRVDKHYERFGDRPIEIQDRSIYAIVEDLQTIMIASSGEVPNERIRRQWPEYIKEHPYYKKAKRKYGT